MATTKFLGVDTDGSIMNVACASTGGATDANKVPQLDAIGRLSTGMMPIGIGQDTLSIPATENLSAGDFVNIYDNAGAVSVRKADNATTTKYANGYVKLAVTSGATAVVYMEGGNDTLTGLATGTRYYLGVTGGFTTTPPTAAGSIIQPLGIAISTTVLRFEQKDYIKNM